MPDESIEQRLRTVPRRRLSSEAEMRISDAILAAEAAPSPRWWARPIPLWQTAAACVAVCVATLALADRQADRIPTPTPVITASSTRDDTTPTTNPNGDAIIIELRPVPGTGRPYPVFQTDPSQWRILRTSNDEGQSS